MRVLILSLVLGIIAVVHGAERATECYVDGLQEPVKVGEVFQHPNEKCALCLCAKHGVFTCKRIQCPTPNCGSGKQRDTADGCCKECIPACNQEICPKPTGCNESQYAYHKNSCCPVCGCTFDLGDEKVNVVPGKFGPDCENCVCHQDGNYTCNRPECPLEKLECINPSFTKSCKYHCKVERTCRRGTLIIKPGQFVSKRNKVCTCNADRYYPRAFCFNSEEHLGEKFKRLQKYQCVGEPTLPPLTEDQEIEFHGPYYSFYAET